VDLLACLLGLSDEIDLSELGIVVHSGDRQKFLPEAITLLSPESIGPMQSVAPFFSVAVQGLVQRGETRMELVLGQGEMENLRHLGFGVTPGTCIGHRQSRRDAAGREEQIAGLLVSESGIKVESKPVVTPDDGGHVGLHRASPSCAGSAEMGKMVSLVKLGACPRSRVRGA